MLIIYAREPRISQCRPRPRVRGSLTRTRFIAAVPLGSSAGGQPAERGQLEELVMAFVTVAVLVYGAFYIAMRSGAYQAVGPNIVMQTGAAAPF